MIKRKKVFMIVSLIILFIIVAGTAIFLSITSGSQKSSNQRESKVEKVQKVSSSKKEEIPIGATSARKILNKELVHQFLVAYYNRADYGTNREQYRPFVTESYYNALVNNEEKVISAGWNGHTVDRVLEKTDIFLDNDSLIALVEVDYKMTYLSKRFDYDGLKNENIPQHDRLKLKFVQSENGEYLVDDISVESSSATTHDHDNHEEQSHKENQPAEVTNGETHYGHD